MKETIDLTENRDFQESVLPHTLILRDPLLNLNLQLNLIPWELTLLTSDNDLLNDSYSDRDQRLFPIGSRKDILHWEEVHKVDSGDYCDRCGINLSRIPWEKTFSSLCSKCNIQLEKDLGRDRELPWERLLRGGLRRNNEILTSIS